MKRTVLLLASAAVAATAFADGKIIPIETDNVGLVYSVGDNGRLYQRYFGRKLDNSSEYTNLPQGIEAYIAHGMEDYFEPALHINHADGNQSTLLKYVDSATSSNADGSVSTVITLADPVYKNEVKLHFTAFPGVDVISSYTEIKNNENKPIELEKYASSLLTFNRPAYYLTQYDGDWANEANLREQKLEYGKKQLDTNLGSRHNMFLSQFFQLGLDAPAQENSGEVLAGTLGWTGNYRYTFEVDNKGMLRVISGINPYNSEYTIAKGETFTTPEFFFTLSQQGKGGASRNFHDWARRYRLKDGMGDRMTLLNNWEATYFDFDEAKLIQLCKDAKTLGVDMFLLDDGWFANKYPRNSDTAGLGDWGENVAKLPNGFYPVIEEAKKQGVKFGLWIEPEMVNPKSELYEKHKDWVITLPNRDEYYFRNQLVLDLSNPKVQDYVFSVLDDLKTKYPEIAFFKWDCNSPITNIYSPYEKNQKHLYVDYVKGLYNVLDRVKAKYPDLAIMMCAGGSGRGDYKGLEYFTEFWPSDNTDPIERLFIQWGYSQVFPAKTLCAHVTSWNRDASIKFRTDVAMMGKLGFDINLHELSDGDLRYAQQAVREYNRLKPAILHGDQFRLVSPYEGEHTSTMYVTKDKKKAVVFAFDVYPRYNEKLYNVKMAGLDPDKTYSVKEINRQDCNDSHVGQYSGDYLMNVGLPMFSGSKLSSRIYEVSAN
ncbi:MAG: alpha-galactosidase [Muribaculaceae bacterium]|nr:alpha-galactosidase [Muribaculaceae bacterium]